MEIRKATIADLDLIVPLFDGYRQFYRQESDVEGAREFIQKRIELAESVIYIAFAPADRSSSEGGKAKNKTLKAVGFTQLYPIFSSVSMERMLLLNDLFIHPDHRGKGIGKSLIDTTKDFCKATNQKGIVIQTETTNRAQQLYEREGFKKDPDLHYFWSNI
ncbi:N-acetyltransferase [Dokdonia sinensis]|uniref:N-acetyltransferase n=1 Tax=Dokdonia sinensis TaxID=2479847 RepID=A0A3M0G827_9FLAO|nr:GNAT family N-acetyltransferase [Dokdonia sinensis]RMB61064.1 N-acetyltransferase [Dokdonia sinensis]